MAQALLAYEDFPAGWSELAANSYTVTREEIISFASEFDPQPMHMDEAAGSASLLGGLAASGWHICAIAMRLMSDAYISRSAGMGSPGLDEVKWLKPVRAGDTLRLRASCLEARVSKSRPEMGICVFLWELLNQRDELVTMQRGYQMFRTRASLGETS